MPPTAFTAPSTERAVIGVLMNSPHFRGKVLQKYPSRLESFFSSSAAIKLLKAVMETDGMAWPAALEPLVPDLVGGEWSPGHVLDEVGFDAIEQFWQNVEKLRRLSKRREARATLAQKLKELQDADADIDALVSDTSAALAKLTVDAAVSYDPSMLAVVERFEEDRKNRKTGRRLTTGIPRLDGSDDTSKKSADQALRGGLRIDPGELVVISGREKQRKTTLVMNMVSAWHRAGVEGATVWISNEQSVTAADLLCHLWALEATRLAYERNVVWTPKVENLLSPPLPQIWTFSKDQLLEKGESYSGKPGEIVQEAYQLVKSWNIRFYCAAANEGNAMDAESVCGIVRTDIEFKDAKRIIVDNLQGFRRSNEDDYAVMNRVVPLVDAFPGTYGCLTLALSQLSRTKAEWSGNNQIKGGGGLEGRANLILETAYDDESAPNFMGVKRTWGRNRPFFDFKDLAIEPNSGLIIDGQPYHKAL